MTDEFSQKTHADGSIDVEVEGQSEDGRVRTLKELLDKFDVDLDLYDVKSFQPNTWETSYKDEKTGAMKRTTNFSAKARLEINKDAVTANQNADAFIELVKVHSPKYVKVKRLKARNKEAVTAVMDLFDLHIGMLAWGEETQDDDWDSYIGVQVAMDAIEDLIDRLQGVNITKIIFPMGNDLLHTDATIGGKGGTTTAGTPQDVDTRYLKMFRMAMQLMIAIIDRLRQIAPVEVIVVPGNHDRERMAYMGEAIFAWYQNDKEVEVNNDANLRKYVVTGKTLLGFTHGDDEKAENLPLIMASEQPKQWGEATFKLFHTGHLHRKRKMLSVSTDTYNGVEVLTLPSLVPPDAWHAQKGYVGGGRAAEAHLYGEESGPCGYFRHSVYSKRG